jgi:hypothetical protein
MPPGGGLQRLNECIVKMCTSLDKPKKKDKKAVERFVVKNLDRAVRYLEQDLKNVKLKETVWVQIIKKRMIQFYLKFFEGEKEQKKKKMPRNWVPDEQAISNAVIKWCSESKDKPQNIKKQYVVKNWVFNNVERATREIEEDMNMEMVGLDYSRELIKQLMIEYWVCGFKTIDVNKPEPCAYCGAPEIDMDEDGKNAKQCVWECEAVIPIPKKNEEDLKELRFVRTCKTPACCYKCSGLPESWNWETDPFYCKGCNRPEIIEKSDKIKAEQEIVDMYTPPEDEDVEDGPVFSKEKKPVEGVRVAHAMGGGGKSITQKKAREMLGMKSGVPSYDGLDLCANPTKDMCGHLEAPPLLKARKPPPPQVFARFLEEYQEHEIATKWHETHVLVKDVKSEMTRLYIDTKKMMDKGQVALDKIKEKMMKEEKDYDADEVNRKPNPNDPNRRKYLKIRLAIIEKEVGKDHPDAYESLKKIESNLSMIRELLRIVKNKLAKDNFQAMEKKCQEFWDKCDCSDIEDDEDLSSGSDSSGDEKECDVDMNS